MSTTALAIDSRAAAYVAALPATDPLALVNAMLDDAVALQDEGRCEESEAIITAAENLLDANREAAVMALVSVSPEDGRVTSSLTGPTGGAWVHTTGGKMERCTCCGDFTTGRVWHYYVGEVAYQTVCDDCADEVTGIGGAA